MQGCPALAQFTHDGVSSSHLIFCERHRAQAVPFLRPPPGCGFCREAGAASAVMPVLASIDGSLRRLSGAGGPAIVCVCRIGGVKPFTWHKVLVIPCEGSVVCSARRRRLPEQTSADCSAFPRLWSRKALGAPKWSSVGALLCVRYFRHMPTQLIPMPGPSKTALLNRMYENMPTG